ncbi:hypothetical protein CWO28_13460 [Vibrio splendidus]|nr:hypothetical protein CWO28_13460 [Vibrio splendidus]
MRVTGKRDAERLRADASSGSAGYEELKNRCEEIKNRYELRVNEMRRAALFVSRICPLAL